MKKIALILACMAAIIPTKSFAADNCPLFENCNGTDTKSHNDSSGEHKNDGIHVGNKK